VNRTALHWVNVDSGCDAAVADYCSMNGRGGVVGATGASWEACNP
jgi:hypothetical protein